MSYICLIFIAALNILFYKTFEKIPFFNERLVDKPNYRKSHKAKAYQIGGVAFGLSFMLIIIFSYFFDFLIIPTGEASLFENHVLILVLFLILILGIVDDIYDTKYYIKFPILIILNLIALNSQQYLVIDSIYISLFSSSIEFGSYAVFFTLLCILLFTNSLNLFDGINLQSGVYLFTIFIFLIIKEIEHNIFITLTIALLIFLFYNFKGKVFLGDAGTLFISTIISYALILGFNQGKILDAEEIFIFMIVPGLDMFRLFIIRIINKKNPFKPDRNHIHHIILDFTKSTTKTVSIIFTIYFIPQFLYYYGLENWLTILIGVFAYLFSYALFTILPTSHPK